MSAPFDTLKLARRFEAAGIEHKQAGDMAEAIAEATVGADLVTKTDLKNALEDLGQKLTIRFGGMLIVAVVLLFSGLGTATTILLNRLPAAATSVPAQRATALPAGLVLAADTVAAPRGFDWDRYHDRQDACAELDRVLLACTTSDSGKCDQAPINRLQRQCSAFGPLGQRTR